MKTKYSKTLGCDVQIPETVTEAVEQLEEFLIADLENDDWSPEYLRGHFDILKKDIERIEREKEKKNGRKN